MAILTKVLNLQTRKRKYDLRMIWNAIWGLVFYYYRKWASLDVFDLLLDRLRGRVRVERSQNMDPV